MPRHSIAWLTLSVAMVIFTSGCCTMSPCGMGGCNDCGGCGSSYAPMGHMGGDCCGSCNDGCGCESHAAPSCGCDSCASSCDSCGSGCNSCGHGLLAGCEPVCGGLFNFNQIGKIFTCQGGCSNEVYYDEWINHPPSCCDPCNNCGQWVGPQSCCKHPLNFGFMSKLWGKRYHGCDSCGDGCGNGCGDCGSGCSDCGGGHGCSSCNNAHYSEMAPVPAERNGAPPQPPASAGPQANPVPEPAAGGIPNMHDTTRHRTYRRSTPARYSSHTRR